MWLKQTPLSYQCSFCPVKLGHGRGSGRSSSTLSWVTFPSVGKKQTGNKPRRSNMSEKFLLYDCTFVLFFPFFFRAAPAAYGHSQARGQIGAVVTSLHHSHSNTGSEPHLHLHYSSRQRCILNPLKDWTRILMDTSHVCLCWATMGTALYLFKTNPTTFRDCAVCAKSYPACRGDWPVLASGQLQ